MAEIAWCPRCEMPLVFTFVISHREFYCVGCGRSWGFLTEPHARRTPEREAEAERLKAQFAEVAKPIIVRDSKLGDCDRCNAPGSGYHHTHVTDEEVAASLRAWEELRALQKVAS